MNLHPVAPLIPRSLESVGRSGKGVWDSSVNGCDLVNKYEVAAVRTRAPNTIPRITHQFAPESQPPFSELPADCTRIPNAVPRTTDGLPTSGNWRCDRVQPRNLSGRLRSHPNHQHRSPNYRRIATESQSPFPGLRRSATECNLEISEVAPLRTRTTHTIPRTTGGLHPNSKRRSPNYGRIADFRKLEMRPGATS